MSKIINKDIKLEIPNNMDIELPNKIFNFLQSYDIPLDVVNCFYTPLRLEDGVGSIRGDNFDGRANISTIDYINIIKNINKYFPNKVQILIQNDIVLTIKQLKFYTNLGINKFCCGNYNQAKIIREILPNAEICASITMGIYDYDIYNHPEYKGIFNDIILPFKYARKLDVVNSLPKDFKYRMILNSNCSIFCEGVQHWAAEINKEGFQHPHYCPLLLYDNIPEIYQNKCNAFVKISDIKKFKNINCWKVLDRSFSTEHILVILDSVFIEGLCSIDDEIDYNSYYKYVDIYNKYILSNEYIKAMYPLK